MQEVFSICQKSSCLSVTRTEAWLEADFSAGASERLPASKEGFLFVAAYVTSSTNSQ